MPLDGEIIKETFYLVAEDPDPPVITLPLAANKLNDCCGAFAFKYLADIANSDEYRNDVSTVTWKFNDIITAATMKLLQYNGSSYVEVAVLNNNTYGTLLAYGDFVNNAGEKFVGYTLNWRAVISAFDTGSFKVELTITKPTGTSIILSDEFCIQAFTEEKADKTMRIEYYMNGIIGDNTDDNKTRDYGTLNRYNSLRLPGWFGFPKSTYTKDYTIYTNGSRKWVQDEQEQEFIMQIKAVSNKVHELMRTDVLQADEIFITDYNVRNPQQWIKKSVQSTSDYPPDWQVMKSKLSPVKLTFRSAINNHKKYRD